MTKSKAEAVPLEMRLARAIQIAQGKDPDAYAFTTRYFAKTIRKQLRKESPFRLAKALAEKIVYGFNEGKVAQPGLLLKAEELLKALEK